MGKIKVTEGELKRVIAESINETFFDRDEMPKEYLVSQGWTMMDGASGKSAKPEWYIEAAQDMSYDWANVKPFADDFNHVYRVAGGDLYSKDDSGKWKFIKSLKGKNDLRRFLDERLWACFQRMEDMWTLDKNDWEKSNLGSRRGQTDGLVGRADPAKKYGFRKNRDGDMEINEPSGVIHGLYGRSK